MSENTRFFLNFLRHPGDVSSLIPTSKGAAEKLCESVPEDAKVIMEYGPGTGVIADTLLRKKTLPPDAQVILIEKVQELSEALRAKFHDHRVRVFNDSAENAREILHACGHTHADCVILSIPLSLMTEEVRSKILCETKEILLPDNPLLVALFRPIIGKYLREVFTRVQKTIYWKNVPPLQMFVAKP